MTGPRTGYWVPTHVATPGTPAKRAIVSALGATGIWHLLSTRAQRALCACPDCRGETP